jgi:Ran GTPase-activating protein (RanGAP) involved in mRNA processing and transport
MTELNVSGNAATWDGNKHGEMSGVIALADAIPDMRAISSVNVLGNSIGVEQAQELIKILQARDKLTTVCGFSGDETELDLSNHNLSAGCAVLIANEISDMGALSVLSLKSNRLATKEGGEALAQALANNYTLKELDVSSNNWRVMGEWKGDGPGFAQELATGIKDNGALIKLDISSNYIAAAQGGGLQRICAAGGIKLVK